MKTEMFVLVTLGACEPNSNDMKYPVILMDSVQKIAQGFQSLLTDKDKKRLAGYIQKLGFDDLAAMFYDLQPESGKRVITTLVNTGLYWRFLIYRSAVLLFVVCGFFGQTFSVAVFNHFFMSR